MRVPAAILVLVVLRAPAWADEVRLHAVNVGQGEGLLLECPDGSIAMVVDSADPFERDGGLPAWQAYVSARLREGDVVPLVVASHPHADHIGGLAWLMRRNPIELFVDNGIDGSGTVWNDYADARARGRVRRYVTIGADPTTVALCGGRVQATLFAPAGLTQKWCQRDHNRCSVLVRVDFGATSFLLTGDAEKAEEKRLLADDRLRRLIDVDVLKVGHHGSATSSTPRFLAAVTPTCAVISAGDWQRSTRNAGRRGYHLPRVVTLRALDAALPSTQPWRRERVRAWDERLKKWVSRRVRDGVSVTALDGDVVVRSDGRDVVCR